MILHITTRKNWAEATAAGEYRAASLQSDGFIHCSTANQVVDTANLFFHGQPDLVLLIIDEAKLRATLKYESPTGGGAHDPRVGPMFPHVYGPIDRQAVRHVVEFPCQEDGTFNLPIEIQPMI